MIADCDRIFCIIFAVSRPSNGPPKSASRMTTSGCSCMSIFNAFSGLSAMPANATPSIAAILGNNRLRTELEVATITGDVSGPAARAGCVV